jgi:Domain of unknown function (DUF4359)
MKRVRLVAGVTGVLLIGLGAAMAMTNPPQSAFEDFALEHLRVEGCKQMPFGLAKQCPRFVDDNQPQIKRLMTRHTERQDFVLFSLYRTDLSLGSIAPNFPLMPMVPSFQFQTVGVLGQFYLFEARRQSGRVN